MTRPWPLAAGLGAELLPARAAAAHVLAWQDLAARALEPNVFFGPDLALAGARHLPGGRAAEVLLAWRGEGETRRLVGCLPLARARGRHANPVATRRAAANYGTLSTPLLDPDRPEETWAAMLGQLRGAGIRTLVLPFLHEGGPVAAVLGTVCAGTNRPVARLAAHERAFLQSPLAGAEYLKATLEARRRKEADRQRRRLGELGTLAFTYASSEQAIPMALDEFLVLEAAGWKGRGGTALAMAPGGAAFIREVATGAAGAASPAGRFAVATLRLDGRPVAAGLVATAGRRAFYMKTAFDEALARFSPGLLLTLNLTRHLLDDPEIDDVDSIAVADHPMIDRVWTARFPVATVAVATVPGGGPLFTAALATERARERGIAALKAGSAALARWRARPGKDAARKPAAEASV